MTQQLSLYYLQNKYRLVKDQSEEPASPKGYYCTYGDYINAMLDEYGKDIIILG